MGGRLRRGVPRLPAGVSIGRDGVGQRAWGQAARDNLGTAGTDELNKTEQSRIL